MFFFLTQVFRTLLGGNTKSSNINLEAQVILIVNLLEVDASLDLRDLFHSPFVRQVVVVWTVDAPIPFQVDLNVFNRQVDDFDDEISL